MPAMDGDSLCPQVSKVAENEKVVLSSWNAGWLNQNLIAFFFFL